MKLNIGCGTDIRKGYINIDCVKNKGIDKILNLNKIPYPFEESSVDEILAKDILEHLEDAKAVVEELWRIAKPNAMIYIRVPHYTSHCAWGDLTHIRPFSRYSFNYYGVKERESYRGNSLNSTNINCPVKFSIKSRFLFNRIYRCVGLEFLFNRFPTFYEKLLCFMFPCGLLEFKLIVIKNDKV